MLEFSQLSGTPYGNLEDLYGSYDDNNEVAEEEEAIMKAPSFVSLPLDVVVNEGETIRLPCIVSRSVDIRASLLQYCSTPVSANSCNNSQHEILNQLYFNLMRALTSLSDSDSLRVNFTPFACLRPDREFHC